MFKNKLVLAIVSVVVIAATTTGIYFLMIKNKSLHYQYLAVQKSNITQEVNVTGQVQPAEKVDLAFVLSGKISAINVQVGDQVKKNQILMELDTGNASAAVDQAKATVATAQAAYDKLLAGPTSEDIANTQAAVDTASTALKNTQNSYQATQAQQKVSASNAYSAMLNSGLAAIPSPINSSTAIATISGTYTGTDQGSYNLSMYNGGGGTYYTVSGLENGSGVIVRGAPLALGTRGLYITFGTSGTLSSNDVWSIAIPNTQASGYLAAYNAYQAALQTQNQAMTAAQAAIDAAQTALEQTQAALNLKLAKARPQDVETVQAQLSAAQAQLSAAEKIYSNNFITAPLDAVVTAVNTKVGEIVMPNSAAISLNSLKRFQVKTALAETDYTKVKVSDEAQVTLDAYGSNETFPATVISIDPAATMIQNNPTYQMTLEFNHDDQRIKAGMVANITIMDQTHHDVIVIPARDVINKNTDRFVLRKKTTDQTEQIKVATGISSVDGKIEITSGLNPGDQIVDFGN